MLTNCAQTCDCNITLANTGVGCTPLMKVVKKLWVMNAYKADGTLNYIDLSVTLNDAYFVALINHTDTLQRLYPLPEMKNIEDKRDTPVTYEFADGSKVFIRDQARTFTGMFPPDSASPQLTGTIESLRCGKPAIFGIDADGQIIGKVSADGTKLYPVLIDPQSIAAIFTKATDTDPQMLGMMFSYHTSEKDCKLRGVAASELTGGINPLDYTGLLNVNVKVISCTTTVLTVKLFTDFGSVLNPLVVKQLLATNFALYNRTTSTAILLTGTGAAFAETPEGTYAITYKTADDPASTNTLRLTPTKNGYDFTGVVATSIVVA